MARLPSLSLSALPLARFTVVHNRSDGCKRPGTRDCLLLSISEILKLWNDEQSDLSVASLTASSSSRLSEKFPLFCFRSSMSSRSSWPNPLSNLGAACVEPKFEPPSKHCSLLELNDFSSFSKMGSGSLSRTA